jgi:hypothetical protein
MYICQKFWFDLLFFENHDRLNIKKFRAYLQSASQETDPQRSMRWRLAGPNLHRPALAPKVAGQATKLGRLQLLGLAQSSCRLTNAPLGSTRRSVNTTGIFQWNMQGKAWESEMVRNKIGTSGGTTALVPRQKDCLIQKYYVDHIMIPNLIKCLIQTQLHL